MSEMREKRALVTGGCGFAGSHLLTLLVSEGWHVTVFDVGRPPGFQAAGARYEKGDIRSKEALEKVLGDTRPHVIFHLAGIAFVPAAEKDKEKALAVNLLGGVNLFEAVKEKTPDAMVVAISSAEVYGKVEPEETPLAESAPVRPTSFYAFTKAALENAAFYSASAGTKLIVLRPFNHIGPRQSELFVTSAFARQVAEAETGRIQPVIRVGNLEAVRDFTDVEDTVRAYLLAGQGARKHFLYNICSGKGVRIQEILDILLEMARVEIRVEVDPERLRPLDRPVLIGDNTRFSRETGWHPQIDLRESLGRILDFWRERFKA